VREADVVVVCLSKQFNQAGFRQKEVRLALDTAMEKPEGEIFIIPARLEECDNLNSLQHLHWLDLFEKDGYERLMRTLRSRLIGGEDERGSALKEILDINADLSPLPIEMQTFLSEQFMSAQNNAAREISEISKVENISQEDLNAIKNIIKNDVIFFTKGMIANLTKAIPRNSQNSITKPRTVFTTSPFQDSHVTTLNRENFLIRYGYFRKKEYVSDNLKGEDFLAFSYDKDRIVFSVCDGFGPSFHGDISAELLGSAMMDWIWDNETSVNIEQFKNNFTGFLNDLTVRIDQVVQDYPLPEEGIIRMAEEIQRQTSGSETTLVVGDINLVTKIANFAWLGNTRLRLWNTKSEIFPVVSRENNIVKKWSSRGGPNYNPPDRWSSRMGIIGKLRTFQIATDEIQKIISYTDGMSILDNNISLHLSNKEIEVLIAIEQQAMDDDVALLEISLLSPLKQN